MKTISITHQRLIDIIDSQTEVNSGTWRWGHTNSYVFKDGDRFYMVNARFHVEEGLQDDGAQLAHEVEPVEVKTIVWKRVASNEAAQPA